MKHFINQEFAERCAHEFFRSVRTTYYLYGLMALGVAASAGPAPAAIWLGLALLAEEARKALAAHVAEEGFTFWSVAALDAAGAAVLAAAPAIAWFSRAPYAAGLALALLAAAYCAAAFQERQDTHERAPRWPAQAAFGALALLFALDALIAGAAAQALAIGVGAGFAAAMIAFRAVRAERAALLSAGENAVLVRQFNAGGDPTDTAAWELHFASKTLHGSEGLAQILGRDVTFEDVVENACFATPEDTAIAQSVLGALPGPARSISFEHELIDAKGARVRVRHQGVVRVDVDQRPLAFTCLTQRVRAPQVAQAIAPATGAPDAAFRDSLLNTARFAGRALSAQQEVMRTLANELSFDAERLGASPEATIKDGAPLEHACNDVVNLVAEVARRGEEIERSVDALAHARHAAEAANLAKSQFLANMSHELRTPLNAIMGYAEILQEDAEDDGRDDAVQDSGRILAAARHLLSLINEILDLSKIEAGRMDVTPAPFEPNEMIDELLDTVRPIAEKNGNKIVLSGARPEGVANTDAMKLRQCLLNFLSNAAKFTKGGTVELTFDRRAIGGVDHLCFDVKDSGIGMSSDQLARLFQPFVQADPSITQQFGGTGLGLTITHRFAEMLGGDIEVKSALGEGSQFSLRIPAAYRPPNGATSEVDALVGDPAAPLVVVIEDEIDARDLAARALTRAGFSVLGVGGGEAGLALARAKAPALVLLDIFLPDRSGWRVLQSLKNDPKTCDIPVVVVSINEDRAHALSLGAAEHMVKPVDRDVLAAAVMRFARKRAATSAGKPGAEPVPLRPAQSA